VIRVKVPHGARLRPHKHPEESSLYSDIGRFLRWIGR
jgi:hypothetical protein